MIKLARQYIASGMVLVKIPKGRKGPETKGWNLKENCITDAGGLNGGNIGLAHAYSGTCALDIDDYQGADAWLAKHGIDLQALLMAHGAVQIVSGRPNKAKLLYRLAEPLPSVKILGEGGEVLFELRCAAANGLTVQDVLPPSIHPDTGKPYEWRGNWRELPLLPEALLALWKGRLAPHRARQAQAGGAVDDNTLEYVKQALSVLSPDLGYDGWLKIGMALHAGFGGSDAGLELWDTWSSRGNTYREGECAYRWGTISDKPNGVSLATLFHMAGVKPESGAEGPPVEAYEGDPEAREPGRLHRGIGADESEKKTSATLAQAVQWLEAKGCIRFDEFKNTTLYRGRAIRDEDVGELRIELENERSLKAGRDLAFDAVCIVAGRNRFDSLKDYISGLRWDGVERLRTLMADALGCVQDEYASEIGMRFLVGAVERAMRPGCLHRVSLILAGDENIGKSSFCRDLCKEEAWFTDTLPPDLHDKAASEAVLGRWILESPEMASFKRSAQEAIKAFISRPVEKFRPAYGRCVIEYPRRCVLVGTTNNLEPLAEGEQNTRFWPITVRAYNGDYVKAQRDQLWAEAKTLYEAGMRWWDFDASAERTAFTEADEWLGAISHALDPSAKYTIAEIALSALGISTHKVDLPVKHRIGRCLRSLGWKTSPRHKKTDPRRWEKA